MEKLIEGEFFLEKFSGKGGWTFVRLPLSQLGAKTHFGMLKVSGSVDSFEFSEKTLMPMGDGFLFLPISKEIRTQIKKGDGEKVILQLFRNGIPTQLTEELRDCLLDDPGKLDLYLSLTSEEQTRWLEMIYSANTEEQKAERIVRLLEYLGKNS
ncbi:YdeI/OmpD-associated family protein [Algoriphagus aquatilis]|uniref:YdeI/OmpD-associated family protein n=1 Tax=Algoriphagus aquatilis TaxID=490186 RepID=A0ABW0BVY1_9BACT